MRQVFDFIEEAFREIFEERAAIAHFDGLLPIEEAESLAKAEAETVRRALLEGNE